MSVAESIFPQTMVDVHDADAVTRIGDEAPCTLPIRTIWKDIRALYQTGLHPAIALNVRWKGRTVLDRTIGHVDNHPLTPGVGRVATPDTPFNLFSASKIVTAVLVHALVEDGLFSLDDRAAEYVPSFSSHGKHRIRIRHLLNHTAGIPDMPRGLDVATALRTGILPVEVLADVVPHHAPGRRVAYHPVSSWMVIQEIIEQLTGKPLRRVLEERLLEPLGFERLRYGVPTSDVDLVAKHAITGPPVPGLMARIFERTIGTDLDTAVGITNRPEFLTATLPSANVVATPREVSRFMQLLLNGGILDGVRVLSEKTLARAISEVTPLQLDRTFGMPVRYGLGVMMGGRRFSLFGLNTTGAYGHLGLSTVIVYADPARELAVSFLNTGKPMLAPGMLRWALAVNRIASLVPRG